MLTRLGILRHSLVEAQTGTKPKKGKLVTTTKFIYFSLWFINPPSGNLSSELPAHKKTLYWKRLLITELFVAAPKYSTTKDWFKKIMVQKKKKLWYSYTIKYYETKTKTNKQKIVGNILSLNYSTFTNIHNYQNASNYILKLIATHCM